MFITVKGCLTACVFGGWDAFELFENPTEVADAAEAGGVGDFADASFVSVHHFAGEFNAALTHVLIGAASEFFVEKAVEA